MKKVYEKPVINKIEQSGGKFGAPINSQKIRSEIDGIRIVDICSKFGSPVYVFSEKKIEEKYKKAYDAFSSRYPNVVFSWSYKTNYLKAICAKYHQLGSTAEVVSEFEYQKARALGVKGENIIFNGPYKPYDSLKLAVEENAKIHIDHFDEINDLEKISDELGRKINVAVRLNMDTGVYPQWNRFGFNIENMQAIKAIKRIKAGGKLELTGLHSHIGTFMLDANAYKVQTTKIIQLLNEVEEKFDFNIEYIDIGGGFASLNKLKGIYQPPEVTVPSIDDYAEAITSAIYENINGSNFPKLYLETGRHLIDEAGFLISTVVGSKSLPDGRRSYIVDAGVNLLYTHAWYNFNIELEKEVTGMNEASIINGPLCMNIDVISEHIVLPRLEKESKIIISPVGAYCLSQWMQFIRYRPKVVMITTEKNIELIRDSETLEDVESKEILPDKFKS